MKPTGLSLNDYIDATDGIIDTIWELRLKEEEVYVWRDRTLPSTTGQTLDLEQTLRELSEHNVYGPDQAVWNEFFCMESLRSFIASGRKHKRMEIRFIGAPYGFEWHEIFLSSCPHSGCSSDRLLLFARSIESEMRSHLVEMAAQDDYDYVTYIDANTNHHIRYLSSHSSENLLPPEVGDNYEKELMEYNRAYLPEDEWEETTRLMSLDNVLKELEQNKEYILYSRTIQNGILRDKKLRYSYYDRQRKIILLTRSDITEIREEKRQKELLQDALNAAQVANQAKSTFLSRMSHDIRTPMNAIIGLTAIAASCADDPDRVIDCMEKITSSSKLLLSLINEVLDMSKIESGRIVLSEEDFLLDSLFKDVISMIQPDLKRRGHTLNIHIETLEHEAVCGDMQRLQQIINNLLSNAIKYTPHGGTITLELSEARSPQQGYGTYRLVCEDNGVGISPEFIERVFEPFERAEDERIRGVQGTGLGMAITRNIARMMDGDILVESTPGLGSRFTVTFNLRLRNQILPDSSVLTELPVLVADDDRIVCEETCRCLNQIGMNSSFVTSGKEAVSRVVSAHRDLKGFFAVIVDLRMPDMDGIEVTRQIRAQAGSHVPIIVISAYDTAEYETAAKEAGANGFISKPLFPSKLICMLRRFALHEEEETRTASLPQLPRADFSNKRILLAEDNLLNQEIARTLLQNTRAHVETAADGREAVEMFAASFTGYYDLIFMDIQMPLMDGYQATRRIRAMNRPDAATIPIVAMTANAFTEDIKLAMDAGMNQHMAKPIDIRQLETILYRWLG